MTSPTTPPHGQADPAALLALGLATQAADAGPSSAPPLTPGELAAEFPRLEILELLGRGGMGAVYKARQRDLDRLVALKILRPGLDADPGFAERFTREARALAQLNHPGIVTLYEFGKTSAGRYFILMEFVDGVNLRQLLSSGRLSPREALAIVPPLCDALQYAHDRGLIHRDIKPENILIDRLGRVKIADFGIARLASEGTDRPPGRPSGNDSPNLTSAGEVMGTPHYMAPEQRDRPAEVDHRADLYALGVVFYQMLTGELPAAGKLQPPSHRVQLDVRLDEIVLRALEKDPARRYAAASEMKTQVETVVNAHTQPVAKTPTYHRKTLLVTLAAIAALILCSWAYFTISAGHADEKKPAVLSEPASVNAKDAAANPSANIPPRLRALDWLDHVQTKVGHAWLPSGENAPDVLLLPPAAAISVEDAPEARFLCLWFSHPLFDKSSYGEIMLLDPDNRQPLETPTKSWAHNNTGPDKTTVEGWTMFAMSPGKFGAIPPRVIVRLKYSLAPWIYVGELPLKPNYLKFMTGGTMINAPGQDQSGQAFIDLTQPTNSTNEATQWDLVALTRDNRRLAHKRSQGSGSAELTTRRLFFESSLAEIRAFEIRKRPIRTVEWTVPLHDGSSLSTRLPRTADRTSATTVASSTETHKQTPPAQPSVQFLMQASPATFPELTVRLREIIVQHFPEAQINEDAEKFDASFATQEFQIHNQSKSGAITPAARTQTGPSNNGFMLTVSPITEPDHGQIVLPAAGRAPYWNYFLTTGFDPDRREGVHVSIRFGSNLSRSFHEQITRILGWIHQPARQLLDNQGQPLTVVSEPFLTEKDIATIDKISGSDGRKLRVSFTPAGSFRLNQLTQAALGRRIAILIDGRVLTAPVINAELSTNEIELPDALTEPETQRLLAAFPGPAAGAYTQVVNQAHDWLRIVDQGDYGQSWLNASASLRKTITQEAWTAALQKVRGSSAAITVTRRLKTTQVSSVLPGAGDANYFILQFHTDIDNESVAERLTLTKEPSGDWRVAGYLVRPSSGTEQEAVSKAQAWLEQIDAGQFGLSWDLASDAFRLAITRDQWIASLNAIRPSLGKVKIRLINTTQTTTNLPGAPDGRYIVMTFNTAFENKRTAVETVTFEELKDGTLRASGYFIK